MTDSCCKSVLDWIPGIYHADIRTRTSAVDLVGYIQTAIDDVISAGGGELYFPAGAYPISDSLEIANANRLNLRGEGRNLSLVVRTDTSGPIIRLLNASSSAQPNGYDWHWEGLGFSFSSPADTDDEDAIGVSFETGTGNIGFGYVNFFWRDIDIGGANVAISNDYGAGDPPNVWGWSWENLVLRDFACRALYFTNGGTGGFPNCRIASIYVQGRAEGTYSTDPFYCDAIDGWSIDALEWNVGTYAVAGLLFFTGARALNIGSARFEAIELQGSSPALIFSEAADVVAGALSVQGVEIASGATAAVVRTTNAAQSVIQSLDAGGITGAGLLLPCVGNIAFLGPISPASGSWFAGPGGYAAPWLQVTQGGLNHAGTQVVGARQTGWAPPTGTSSRASFATSTVTTSQLAERVKALIEDLTAHGLIGA